MELSFLNPELKTISVPDEQDIEDALMKLALLKGKEKTGVVLLHSNGRDFLQCYVMDDEECSEFASGKKASSSGPSKKPSSPRYYVECFVRTEESFTGHAAWSHPGWQHASCWYVKMKYVVKSFRGFVAGDEKWQKGFSWSDKTQPPKIVIPLYILTFIFACLWVLGLI